MKLCDLLAEVEIQSEKKVVYFDEEKTERVEIPISSEPYDFEIMYMYSENGILFIEVSEEDYKTYAAEQGEPL